MTHSRSKNLVLIGGGHAHAIALRLWGMNPVREGARVILIADVLKTPYSGMLPAHVAGFYNRDEIHIDLGSLSAFARAEIYHDRAVALDLKNRLVICAKLPPVAFDYLSIDIGSTPKTIPVPGAAEYAISIKPVPGFLRAWQELLDRAKSHPQEKLTLAIVGGGAGGVELALNMQRHLHQILFAKENLKIHIFHSHQRLVPDRPPRVGQILEKILRDRGIELHLSETVGEVEPDKIRCESGLSVECDRIFWSVRACAPEWIKDSGLATDSEGFILVNDNLVSVSHPEIFAAGDIATMQNHPRPKAGVFAVRQGKPLFNNWQRILQGKNLKPHTPQKQYLILIGTGDRRAIASKGSFVWRSPLMWWLKNFIDRRFMSLFSNL